MDIADRFAWSVAADYPFFCKRALFIDDYYTTFNSNSTSNSSLLVISGSTVDRLLARAEDHVTLVDDDGGVVGVDKTGLTTAVSRQDKHPDVYTGYSGA